MNVKILEKMPCLEYDAHLDLTIVFDRESFEGIARWMHEVVEDEKRWMKEHGFTSI